VARSVRNRTSRFVQQRLGTAGVVDVRRGIRLLLLARVTPRRDRCDGRFEQRLDQFGLCGDVGDGELVEAVVVADIVIGAAVRLLG
jgi:hypothetical protein